jgi:hypothetical protein
MASEDENLPVSIEPQEAWFVNHGLQREEGARTAIAESPKTIGPSVPPARTFATRPHAVHTGGYRAPLAKPMTMFVSTRTV